MKLRAVFECLASGLLFMDELPMSFKEEPDSMLTMHDPSKEGMEDGKQFVFHHLSKQQKEDLTASAQHALRLWSFRKIHEILAIDLIPALPPRRFQQSQKEAKDSAAPSTTEETTAAPTETPDPVETIQG